MTNFPALLSKLVHSKVRFIVIGGAAAIAHGSPRLTLDLDVVYQRDPGNIGLLVEALRDCEPYLRGAPPGLPFNWDAETIRRGLNFTLTTTLGNLDVLGEIAGGGAYEDLLPHTISVQLYGVECSCLNLPHLIRVKRAAGRPQDLLAVAELEAILEEREDRA